MPEIRGQSEKQADGINWTRRGCDELSIRARFFAQLQHFIECAWRRSRKLRQKIRAVRCHLSGCIDGQSPDSICVVIGLPGWPDGIASECCFLCFRKELAKLDQYVMGSCKTDERMIHDDQIVAIEILLDWSLAEFAQRSPVPLDSESRMKLSVFGGAFD
jgi:hypothetical protein